MSTATDQTKQVQRITFAKAYAATVAVFRGQLTDHILAAMQPGIAQAVHVLHCNLMDFHGQSQQCRSCHYCNLQQ